MVKEDSKLTKPASTSSRKNVVCFIKTSELALNFNRQINHTNNDYLSNLSTKKKRSNRSQDSTKSAKKFYWVTANVQPPPLRQTKQ